LAVLTAQVAVAGAGSGSDGPKATASAVSDKQFKKLKRTVARQQQQISQLQQQVSALTTQPGPPGQQGIQGEQGEPGTAPACQGNGSGDTMVSAGAVCIDRYEASIWDAAEGGSQITGAIPAPCTANGQDCDNIFARSVPGVTPSSSITYFQAQAALANVGKRLPSNGEWQQAVAGTPESSATCRTTGGSPVATGSMAGCVSNFGANDMVGNLEEWVADWVPESTTCTSWGAVGTFSSDDAMCLSGASTTATGPGALFRGGNVFNGNNAGPFAVDGSFRPSDSVSFIGFRGAR